MPHMKFTDLNLRTPLQNALSQLGFDTPTTIQEKVFSVAMSGKDICGIAQTGTGKTLAYLLPLLNQWKYNKNKEPQILVLVPTRELVVQVVETVKKLAPFMSLDVIGVYGGTNINTQRAELQNGCDVLVGTPGRLFDLGVTGGFKTKAIKKLVIDEVDEMLNLGFRTQLINIMDLLPQKRQNLVFSATLAEEVEALLQKFFNAPEKIEAAPVGTPVENIQQSLYELPNFYTKLNMLRLLLADEATFSKVLVFVATKKLADDVYEALRPELDDAVGVIHSNKEQNYRFNTVKNFSAGIHRIIIATDIVARGIDISEVTHVINFDLPPVAEQYIHRIGRTGRADRKGIAISFVTPKERPVLEAIEALMKLQVPVNVIPEGLEITDRLTEDEQPKVYMKEPPLPKPKASERGPAFHQKSAKNSKVNVRVSYKDKMQQKYGKPKKRPGKK
jgi:ATP-dependent RNA helicase RhlE